MENTPGFFRRLVAWLVQLPMRTRTQYSAPILRGIKFGSSLKQYFLAKVWKYPLNHTPGPPRHHATLGACPSTPPVRCCATHAFPPLLKLGCYIQLKGYFGFGCRQSKKENPPTKEDRAPVFASIVVDLKSPSKKRLPCFRRFLVLHRPGLIAGVPARAPLFS